MELKEPKKDTSRPFPDARISSLPEGLAPLPMAGRPSEMIPPPPIQQEEQVKREWYKFCYDSKNNTFCDRSCTSWLYIISYSIFYIIFLATFTLVLLYVSLYVLKSKNEYNFGSYTLPSSLLEYENQNRIGLTATPAAVNKMSLISYKDSSDYVKYVTALEKVVKSRNPTVSKELGPCGAAPFGYGNTPCVIIRINRHFGSSAQALKQESLNSKAIPSNVKKLGSMASKLWLQCSGNSPYDAEHIGTIRYYPDPPGFEPGSYAPGDVTNSDLIGVQFSNFTKGMALAVECNLYYEGGKSTVDFVIYVRKK